MGPMWTSVIKLSTAELVLPAVADQVRTARVVVAAAARRAGMDETGLDAVRLAVGEACARATQRAAPCDEIDITMSDDDGWFVVEVRERVEKRSDERRPDDHDLAGIVIEALSQECSQSMSDDSIVTRMAWPIS